MQASPSPSASLCLHDYDLNEMANGIHIVAKRKAIGKHTVYDPTKFHISLLFVLLLYLIADSAVQLYDAQMHLL